MSLSVLPLCRETSFISREWDRALILAERLHRNRKDSSGRSINQTNFRTGNARFNAVKEKDGVSLISDSIAAARRNIIHAPLSAPATFPGPEELPFPNSARKTTLARIPGASVQDPRPRRVISMLPGKSSVIRNSAPVPVSFEHLRRSSLHLPTPSRRCLYRFTALSTLRS